VSSPTYSGLYVQSTVHDVVDNNGTPQSLIPSSVSFHPFNPTIPLGMTCSSPNSSREDVVVGGPGPPIITSDEIKGPVGSNLFVFHLPSELTNWDLYLLFRKYGTILSVHTMVDKVSGLSRGFGFVSYSCVSEALDAIANLDGLKLGKKRLKVQQKRESWSDDTLTSSSMERPSRSFSSMEEALNETLRSSSVQPPGPTTTSTDTCSSMNNDAAVVVTHDEAKSDDKAERTPVKLIQSTLSTQATKLLSSKNDDDEDVTESQDYFSASLESPSLSLSPRSVSMNGLVDQDLSNHVCTCMYCGKESSR
jgi:RNA recognition motif-containing protein